MNSYIYTTILNSRIYIKAIDPINFLCRQKYVIKWGSMIYVLTNFLWLLLKIRIALQRIIEHKNRGTTIHHLTD